MPQQEIMATNLLQLYMHYILNMDLTNQQNINKTIILMNHSYNTCNDVSKLTFIQVLILEV